MADIKIIKKLEMSISPENKTLNIAIKIDNSPINDTVEKLSEGAARAYIKVFNQDSGNNSITETESGSKASVYKDAVITINKTLTESDLGCSVLDNMFFVEIEVTLSQVNPLNDEATAKDSIHGTVLHPDNLYRKMLHALKQESKCHCQIPKNFIDYYLNYKGLQLSLLTGNKLDAIKYYNYISKNKSHE